MSKLILVGLLAAVALIAQEPVANELPIKYSIITPTRGF